MADTPYRNKQDEWMTPTSVAQICYDLLKAKAGQTVINPFDKVLSNFVKVALDNNLNSLNSMTDYLESDHYEYDLLATNPPYSIKDKVIAKVFEYGKPAALVLPADSLSGIRRHQLFDYYGYPSIYVPRKRIAYSNGYGEPIKNGVSFTSIIMLLNVEPSKIYWE